MRRFTRLTNAFSKNWENLKAALAFYFAYYNFCRIHSSSRCSSFSITKLWLSHSPGAPFCRRAEPVWTLLSH